MLNNTNSLIQIKLKHRKYLTIVFTLSVISMIILPSSINRYIPIIYIFLTFVFYGYLGFIFYNKLADYLILKHSKELKELKISNSKSGFDRIQRQFFSKQKELNKISPIVKDGLELASFYRKCILLSFLSTIILVFFNVDIGIY